MFVFLFRAHFRISCMSEINMQECKSKFWHLLYFSHTSILWFQIFACLVQECESEIMFSVSTLSTLKYLQKKTLSEWFYRKFCMFFISKADIFYLCSVCCVTMCKPNNQNLGIATWQGCTVCPKGPNQMTRRAAQQATRRLWWQQLLKVFFSLKYKW